MLLPRAVGGGSTGVGRAAGTTRVQTGRSPSAEQLRNAPCCRGETRSWGWPPLKRPRTFLQSLVGFSGTSKRDVEERPLGAREGQRRQTQQVQTQPALTRPAERFSTLWSPHECHLHRLTDTKNSLVGSCNTKASWCERPRSQPYVQGQRPGQPLKHGALFSACESSPSRLDPPLALFRVGRAL